MITYMVTLAVTLKVTSFSHLQSKEILLTPRSVKVLILKVKFQSSLYVFLPREDSQYFQYKYLSRSKVPK